MSTTSYVSLLLNFALVPLFVAHSTMTEPQATAHMTCRLGGDPQFGVDNCPGPCDLRAIQGKYANFDSPETPAAVYRRGEKVAIKYQRNNHGPGGFIRMTLVKPDDMMDKGVHEKNSFHYSCWGANPTVATAAEKERDRFGFSVTGNDGEQHDFPVAYYKSEITIPRCVPNGDYVLGWAWYGGTGGMVEGNSPQEPSKYGYFGDYWSCSFVKIEDGDDLEAACDVVYENDMGQFSEEGCMSANDRLGVCTYEPCSAEAEYQKPGPFKNGNVPFPVTPETYGGVSPEDKTVQTTEPPTVSTITNTSPMTSDTSTATITGNTGVSEEERLAKRACRCLIQGRRCWRMLGLKTEGVCMPGIGKWRQSRECRDLCCELCRMENPKNTYLCGRDELQRICRL